MACLDFYTKSQFPLTFKIWTLFGIRLPYFIYLLQLSNIDKNYYAKNQSIAHSDAEGSFLQHFKTNLKSIF
jgi:hypothetical protein